MTVTFKFFMRPHSHVGTPDLQEIYSFEFQLDANRDIKKPSITKLCQGVGTEVTEKGKRNHSSERIHKLHVCRKMFVIPASKHSKPLQKIYF